MSNLEQDNFLSKPTDWREWLNDLVRYKDTTLIASVLAENLETIHKEFTFLDEDIVVASHPKSGTTNENSCVWSLGSSCYARKS